MSMLADASGFAGSALILAAFAYVNVLKRAPNLLFNILNFVGAGLLAISLSINFNLPALLLECAWMAIAAYGMLSAFRSPSK